MNTPFLLVTVLPPMPIWILMTTLHVTLDLLALATWVLLTNLLVMTLLGIAALLPMMI